MYEYTLRKQGFTYLITLAIIALVLGIALHFYSEYVEETNNSLSEEYQQTLVQYQKDNIYYQPQEIIDWLSIRFNSNGYFVPNPDILYEPSQLNTNSLRATRYAVQTLYALDGFQEVDRSAVFDFIKQRYRVYQNAQGKKAAGFSSLSDEVLSLRSTMDAVLALESIGELGNPTLNLNAVKQFILDHENVDGGFWDPHYPEFKKQSCLKCTSFAMRALGAINRQTGNSFDKDFIYKIIMYIENSWDVDKASYSELLGGDAKSSYDLFRAFISIWNLKDSNDPKHAEFVRNHLDTDAVISTLRHDYQTKDGVYSMEPKRNHNSMKATHLMIWMFDDMELLDKIDKDAAIRYVLSTQKLTGEYGSDIYNTYSATGILIRFNVATESLPKPAKPVFLKEWYSPILPYILYVISALLLMFYFLKNKKRWQNHADQLQTKVNKDKLTGLFNREYLENAYTFHSGTGEKVSLILLDVDHFKSINDTYGHLTGDNVLKALSDLVGNNIRRTDVLARWGGEEFAILCPATLSGPATILAEKLRSLIEEYDFDEINKVTCSFGIATSHDSEGLYTLFERADKALYQAKKEGRNQVHFQPKL